MKLFMTIRSLLKNVCFFILFLFLFMENSFSQEVSEFNIKSQEIKLLLSKSNYKEAIVIANELYKKYPDSLSVLIDIGICNLYLGRSDITKLMANKYIEKSNKNYDVHNLKGAACENLGELDSAFISYSTAIELNDKRADAFFNRGRLLFNQAKYSEALKDLIIAKKVCPSDVENFNIVMMLGQTYAALKQYDKALIEYKLIEKNNNQNLFLMQNMANSYFFKKDYEKASEYFTKILEIDSNNVDILNNRALCYNELQESEKAELDYIKIEKIQKEKGVQINLLKYKEVVPADKSFKFKIPENWRAFSYDKKDTVQDTVIIKFFNKDFYNVVNADTIAYNFGGELKIIKNNIKDTTTNETNDILAKMALIADKYILEREMERSKYNYYRITFRKLFNSNPLLIQGLVKAEYDDNGMEKRYIIEYYAVNNKGDLAKLYLWVPLEDAFFYEKLLEYIIETFNMN